MSAAGSAARRWPIRVRPEDVHFARFLDVFLEAAGGGDAIPVTAVDGINAS